MKKWTLLLLLFLFCSVALQAQYQPEYSTAGFYILPNSGREVYNMNVAWRFQKGKADGAQRKDFDDSEWSVVSVPHGLEYLPAEASGCINYQGEAWYRKYFSPNQALKGKRIFLHFEAIMGKSKIWVNGQLMKEHFGGFLPAVLDITDVIDWEAGNVIAVCADNSDDPMYPPGKAQNVLDFSYFGGIYRDCWMIAHNDVFITDPNYENQVAGGGVFVAYDNVSAKSADVLLNTQVRNNRKVAFGGKIVYQLTDISGKQIASLIRPVKVLPGNATAVAGKMTVKNPSLWSPESPELYWLTVQVKNNQGKTVDGYRKKIGIRSIEFKGVDGFWLNGKPYPYKLIGANRHQDFAVVGNALSNSTHWKDAKKLRSAGMRIIRNAHYPQDPAFMDACDELGLFVIVNTPGWQFWNKDPLFEQRVYSDVRNMVRRDRNHPSVLLWEPILNETWYPDYFAKNVHDFVLEEYPYPGCYPSCDSHAKGHEHFPVLFAHPSNSDPEWAIKEMDPAKTYFAREWGDNVDDWNSHNSDSRVSRKWGERPMLVQVDHYAKPSYLCTCYDGLYRTTRQHFGGTLWHSFDHQRGYHPDPFYGGLMDVFRQPKYSYYMFMAQRDVNKSGLIADNGPMVYIAHEMTPFSDKDVEVYSNCDEVRLTVYKDGKQLAYHKPKGQEGMPSPVIRFENVYGFMDGKALSVQGKGNDVYLLAEGLMDGKVVATCKREPSRRPSKIVLWLDNEGVNLVANGSDFVTVVAGVADQKGNIKRLNNYDIKFTIEGEGRIMGDAGILANPRQIVWGTAPVLVQSTTHPGKIKVKAEVLMKGSQMPVGGEIEFETVPSTLPLVFDAAEAAQISGMVKMNEEQTGRAELEKKLEVLQKELNTIKLKEVEKQQEDFGERNKKK